MKTLRILAGLLWLSCISPGLGAQQAQFFPFAWRQDDFDNGLRLVTVPTEHSELVALYIIVQTGSRNEVEPGKSGFAHFFEHMMFRGSERFTSEQRDAILKRAGASINAYTSDDRTVYHVLISKQDLDKVLEMEADRFQRLKYSQYAYRTEALAVLGEYNKNSANPFFKLHEVVRSTAFGEHTYKHTTMGFLADIKDMPNQYDYSVEFYRRFYRPEYTTILLVGDVTRDGAREMVKKYFGDWKRGDYSAKIPAEPPQKGPRSENVAWPAPTLPVVVVAFRGPPYSDTSKEKAALDLLEPVAFGENSELYHRLVLKEQKVDVLEASFPDRIDPELFQVIARVKDGKDVAYVREQILSTFQRFATETVTQEKLDATRSRLRYGTALGWTSPAAIAGFLAPYISLARSPATVESLFALYDRITPAEIRAAAALYFTDDNRTTATLATQTAPSK